MKKHIWKRSLLAWVCIGALALCGCGQAGPGQPDGSAAEEQGASSAVSEADFSYEEGADGVTLTAYAGAAEELAVPAEVGGKPVTAIGESCFAGNLSLTKVTVPEGVKAIGDYAFECCGRLTKIYLPEGLESIGDGAFSGCVNLMLADIQDGLKRIGRGAFLTCSSLIYLELPESLEEIGAFACSGCSDLAKVIFRGNGVTELPDRVFYGCSGLTDVNVPESVTAIGRRAFSGCESLQTLYVPSELTAVGAQAFENCYALSSVDLKVPEIAEETFAQCSLLGYFNLAEGTEKIGPRAFAGTDMTDVYLPACVKEIAEGAFDGSQIKSVTADECPAYQVIDGALYTADGKTLVSWFPADPNAEEPAAEAVIPDGVETIGGYAFACVMDVSRVVLPASVKEVRAHAFTNSGVEDVVIPEGASVDETAFEGSPMEAPAEEDAATEGEPEASESGEAQAEDEAVAGDSADSAEAGEVDGQSQEASEPEEAVSEAVGSEAGEKSLFREEDFAGYRTISNEEYDAWSAEYLEYYSQFYPADSALMPYIMMYKGEVIPHYMAMTYVQNHDPAMGADAAAMFGEDFEETYVMMNHGLFTELKRAKMKDDLVLYSGVYDSQLMAAAGTETVPTKEQLIGAIGNTFTDPVMISTTTDPGVACNFSDTLFVIYASAEAMEALGAVSIDSFVGSNEKEILMCENARYKILDVGTMAVDSTDEEDQPVKLYRNYVTVELLAPEDAE